MSDGAEANRPDHPKGSIGSREESASRATSAAEPYAAEAGTWTLRSPSGNTYHEQSPLACLRAEQKDRIPAEVALKRIFAAVDEQDDIDARNAETVDRLHHSLAKHGWHPGRTDEPLADCVEKALAAGPVGPYPNKRAALTTPSAADRGDVIDFIATVLMDACGDSMFVTGGVYDLISKRVLAALAAPDYAALEAEHFGDPIKGTGVYTTPSAVDRPADLSAVRAFVVQELDDVDMDQPVAIKAIERILKAIDIAAKPGGAVDRPAEPVSTSHYCTNECTPLMCAPEPHRATPWPPAEWKMVPLKPTEEMLRAAFDHIELPRVSGYDCGNDVRRAIYEVMVRAAEPVSTNSGAMDRPKVSPDPELVVRRIVEAIEEAKAARPNLDGFYMGLAEAARIARNAGNATTSYLAERTGPASGANDASGPAGSARG